MLDWKSNQDLQIYHWDIEFIESFVTSEKLQVETINIIKFRYFHKICNKIVHWYQNDHLIHSSVEPISHIIDCVIWNSIE